MKPEKKRGPVALTTEPPCNRVEATVRLAYFRSGGAGNGSLSAKTSGHAPEGRNARETAYQGSTGQIWRYRGKRSQVLEMLATMSRGVTQWDTLPWHTRLGGTIHALRRDGLAITTEIEGRYRHARYRLATPGSLIIQPENREAAA